MPIEGPLRELGIHDVFQLLDLSRKTGCLRVTSEPRDNEGAVYFDGGRVVAALIRSNPHPLGAQLLRAGKVSEADLAQARALQASDPWPRRLGDILVASGAITPRELERQVRLQVEAVVFELMSWHEGYFSFCEGPLGEIPVDALAHISAESLLMEGARRIDEWSRIAHRIPHLDMVPSLAPCEEGHASLLDLLPREWEVLSQIDGRSDLRRIATALGTSEFDVARIAYGLLSTGVIELRERAKAAAVPGSEALAEPVAGGAPHPPTTALLAEGCVAARRGALREAVAAWQRYLAQQPAQDAAATQRVRTASELAARLDELLEELVHV